MRELKSYTPMYYHLINFLVGSVAFTGLIFVTTTKGLIWEWPIWGWALALFLIPTFGFISFVSWSALRKRRPTAVINFNGIWTNLMKDTDFVPWQSLTGIKVMIREEFGPHGHNTSYETLSFSTIGLERKPFDFPPNPTNLSLREIIEFLNATPEAQPLLHLSGGKEKLFEQLKQNQWTRVWNAAVIWILLPLVVVGYFIYLHLRAIGH